MNFTKAITLAGFFVASTTINAHPPESPKPNVYDSGNYWKITAYNDASAGHAQWATQGICFLPYTRVGTQIRGIWYSDTFPDWNGRYAQEGDQVFMHGDYAKNVGHDGMVFDVVTRDKAAGHWKEWRENGVVGNGAAYGRTIGFLNTKLKREGYCKKISVDEIADLDIQPKFLRDGRVAENPLDSDQRIIEQLEIK